MQEEEIDLLDRSLCFVALILFSRIAKHDARQRASIDCAGGNKFIHSPFSEDEVCAREHIKHSKTFSTVGRLAPHTLRLSFCCAACRAHPIVTMVNVVLIVVGAIVPFVLLFMNFVLLARYIDPSHAKGHWIAKSIIVRLRGFLGNDPRLSSLRALSLQLFTLTLAECGVLALPFDVVSD